MAEQLIDAQKQATDAATEIKSAKLKIEHLEKEIQAKSKHLQVRHRLCSCWRFGSSLLASFYSPRCGGPATEYGRRLEEA